jgi:hypothetical protein
MTDATLLPLPQTVIDAALLTYIPMWVWSLVTFLETPLLAIFGFVLMIESPRMNPALAISHRQKLRIFTGRFGCVALATGALMIALTQMTTHSTRPSATIIVTGMTMIMASLVIFLYEAVDIETEVLNVVSKLAPVTNGVTVPDLFTYIKIPDRSIYAVGLAIERLEAKGRLERYWDETGVKALYRVPKR